MFVNCDAATVPDLIRAFTPDPVTNRQSGERFVNLNRVGPEPTHDMPFLFSRKGVPASYRHANGADVNAYKSVNNDVVGTLVKYHRVPKHGERKLLHGQAD